MRRILHLIDSWGPGGAETVFADIATGLDSKQFQSFVGLPRASEWLYDEVRRRGTEVMILPSGGAFDLRHIGRLIAAIRRLQVHVVQAHTFGTSVYANIAALACRVPVVSTFHGLVDVAHTDRYRNAKLRLIGAGTGRVVCVSESLRRELLNTSRLGAAQVSVIFNGVDTEHFHPGHDAAVRASLDADPGVFVLGAVGNVRPAKGYEILLDAAALLRDRGKQFKIAVAGSTGGTLFPGLLRQRASLGLDAVVQFVGFRDDAASFLRAVDAYVLPSHTEGFSLSTVQALASGLPVVSTRCGGPEEIVTNGVDGILVPAGSAIGMADAIERLIGDRALQTRLASAARAVAVGRFSTAIMLSRYERLYGDLTPE